MVEVMNKMVKKYNGKSFADLGYTNVHLDDGW